MSNISKQGMVSDDTIQQGKKLAISIISVLYVFVNQIFEQLSIGIRLPTDDINVGIIVLASAAIIFGKEVTGIAAGAGAILVEIKGVLLGDVTASTLSLGTLLVAFALGFSSWLTGFLSKSSREYHSGQNLQMISLDEFKSLATSTVAAIIGLALMNNFIFVVGAQLQEGVPITDGLQYFLIHFISDTIILIVFIPIVLFAYDFYDVFKDKRDAILELLLRDVEVTVPIMDSVSIISVELVEQALTVGAWTPIRLKFKNTMQQARVFAIEAVASSKITPNHDKTALLHPGDAWTQLFYVLPSNQETVSVRLRVTPSTERAYKEAIREETIVEFQAKTKSPNSLMSSLLGFSGVNIGAFSLAAFWDAILNFIGNPQPFIDAVMANLNLILSTVVAELLLFVPLVTGIFIQEKRKLGKHALKLGFSSDLDDQTYQEIVKSKLQKIAVHYQEKLEPLSRIAIIAASITSIGFLGYQGFKILTVDNYQVQNPSLVLWTIVGIAVMWVFGMQGSDLLDELGITSNPEWKINGDIVKEFRPMSQFQEGIVTEVVVKAANPTTQPGIRLKFEGFDTVSPPMVELHIDPKEQAQFKIAVTPNKSNKQNLLVIAYPLFDQNKRYIDPDEAEPFSKQIIQYTVGGQTSLGVSKSQMDKLKIIGGFGSILTFALVFVNQFIPIPSLANITSIQAGIIGGLQLPFVYAYFSITNKFKSGGSFK